MSVRQGCLAGLIVAVIGAGATTAQAAPCANVDLQPAAANMPQVRRATLCLINRQRTKHHLRKLHANTPLRGAAQGYARLMVLLHFFDHVSPTGTTFVDRIRASGYLRNANGWSLGENLAWGSGTESTPRQIVRAWMHSPEHRRNILNGTFRDTGIGIVTGAPVLGVGGGATYVNEFGQKGR